MAPPNNIDGSLFKERIGRLSQEELLQQCKLMLTEITKGITATAGTTAAIGSCHGYDDDGSCNSRRNTGDGNYNLLETTIKLFDVLSVKDKRNHTQTLAALETINNNHKGTDDDDPTSTNYAEDPHRKRFRVDKGPASSKDMRQFPPSIIINHVLPYLDHETWKSVSILSTGIHQTIRKMQLVPPWPTMRGITVPFNWNGIKQNPETRKYNNFSFAFDHTDGSRLVAWNQLVPFKNLGLIFDSRCGLIKEISFDTIIERERASNKTKKINMEVDDLYLLDRKTLLVKLESRNHGQLYLYRLVEDDSSPRNAVGFDIFRHSTMTKWADGPWIFKRNGVIYVAAVHDGQVRSDKVEGRTINIYQYLGETTWPGCLIETHRLQYPEIEFDDDDEDNDAESGEYCQEAVFEFIGQPVKNNQLQYSTTDERFVFVSGTNKGNLHLHCWCVTFDDQTFRTDMCLGTGINSGNNDGEIVPCISLGTTPNPQLRFLNYKKGNGLRVKIVPWPKKDNMNYLFRVIQFIPRWWEDYEDDMKYIERFGARYLDPRPNISPNDRPDTYEDLISTYNMANIFLFDYNKVTNKFDNTNNLSLTTRDQSVLHYDIVFASYDGRYLFAWSGKEEDWGMYRIDTLGCSLVTNFKSITGEINTWDSPTQRLSNNNKMIGSSFQGDGGKLARIHIKYLYFD